MVNTVETKAVPLLLWGYMGSWLDTSTVGILSQNQCFLNFFFIFISMCKIHPSPSFMVVATIDYIYSCAWMQLGASADFRNLWNQLLPYLWRAGG